VEPNKSFGTKGSRDAYYLSGISNPSQVNLVLSHGISNPSQVNLVLSHGISNPSQVNLVLSHGISNPSQVNLVLSHTFQVARLREDPAEELWKWVVEESQRWERLRGVITCHACLGDYCKITIIRAPALRKVSARDLDRGGRND
jgi:hypothetical protein